MNSVINYGMKGGGSSDEPGPNLSTDTKKFTMFVIND